MQKRREDHYAKKAKKEGYAARSVYKLEELNQKYKLLRTGKKVLDLGAAPGSWLVYISEQIGDRGLVVGLDQNDLGVALPKNARFLKADLMECDTADVKQFADSFDVVVSDAAPKTTGNRTTDHLKSAELCNRALDLAIDLLVKDGSFVCKMYQGEESKRFLERLRSHFKEAKTQKPAASRYESREVFFVGRFSKRIIKS